MFAEHVRKACLLSMYAEHVRCLAFLCPAAVAGATASLLWIAHVKTQVWVVLHASRYGVMLKSQAAALSTTEALLAVSGQQKDKFV